VKSADRRQNQLSNWKAIGVVAEGQSIHVGGINIWDHRWARKSDVPVKLPHPAHPHQQHRMFIYEVNAGGKRVTFAAGELSANVWGFYVPD
jgi:hypothetical protein